MIDEIDKSDIDLPSDLLHLFEEGEFEIPELKRLQEKQAEYPISPHDEGEPIPIKNGQVRVARQAFPLVMMTSNEEREFPPAFLRRCLQLQMQPPSQNKLTQIVTAHFNSDGSYKTQMAELIEKFVQQRDSVEGNIAADQLLNTAYLLLKDIDPLHRDKKSLLNALWKSLSNLDNI